MYRFLLAAFLFSSLFWLAACKTETSGQKVINPNGDSELALLMREMFDEGMMVKQSVIDGRDPEMKLPYHHLTTATPTEEGKNATVEYELFAKAYEASIERFKNAPEADRPAAYQNMVDNCMNCHNTICPGPTVRIKKMYLSEKEMELALGKD